MKDSIIGVVNHEDTVSIRISSLIELLCVPVALRMKLIRDEEKQGYSQEDIFPNREFLTQLLKTIFIDGYVHESLTTELNLKGLSNNQIGWSHDYLCLLYNSIKDNSGLSISHDDTNIRSSD